MRAKLEEVFGGFPVEEPALADVDVATRGELFPLGREAYEARGALAALPVDGVGVLLSAVSPIFGRPPGLGIVESAPLFAAALGGGGVVPWRRMAFTEAGAGGGLGKPEARAAAR